MTSGDEVSEQVARTFFRFITGPEPQLNDFRSHAELGRDPLYDLTPEQEAMWRGISMFDSLESSLDRRRRSRHLGPFIAVVLLGEPDRYRAERTGRASGHWTVWAEAEYLLESVVDIIPVER